jgi:hypothetical protein
MDDKMKKRKLNYEKPVLVSLSYDSAEAQQFSGQCINGSVATAAQCTKGGLAKNQCTIGLTAGQRCAPGSSPSRCVSGSAG